MYSTPLNLTHRQFKSFLALFFLFLFSSSLSLAHAQTLYISSQQAKVMAEPAFNASLVTTLSLGDEVTQLSQQGAWFEISMSDGSSGWISRFLARDTPPAERVTVLPADSNVELRDVRRRTSALTTAAAARGLAGSADSGDGLASDPEAVKYMEGFSVSPDSIETFMQPIIAGGQ
jgi:hypothetical protein